MSEVQVRRAGLPDLESLLDLWLELMSHHARLDARFAPEHDARELFRDIMTEWVGAPNRRVVVAVVDGQIVGYAIGSIAENAPVFKLRHFGHVSDICVAPDRRQQGIGRRLFAALRKWFRGRGLAVVQLNVAVHNHAAQSFWRDIGFNDYMDRLWLEI